MYVDLEAHLTALENWDSECTEAVNIRIAMGSFHDLRGYKDHLGVVRLCSAEANAYCDSIHITHRTDTDGGSLEILPFFTDRLINIYADPPIYVVGQRNPNGFGERPLQDWEELLKDAGLSKEVIGKVRQYLRQHPPIDYRDVPE